jgi:hypothetical protein
MSFDTYVWLQFILIIILFLIAILMLFKAWRKP